MKDLIKVVVIGLMIVGLGCESANHLFKGTNEFTEAIQNGDIVLEEWNETFEESEKLMEDYLNEAFRDSLGYVE